MKISNKKWLVFLFDWYVGIGTNIKWFYGIRKTNLFSTETKKKKNYRTFSYHSIHVFHFLLSIYAILSLSQHNKNRSWRRRKQLSRIPIKKIKKERCSNKYFPIHTQWDWLHSGRYGYLIFLFAKKGQMKGRKYWKHQDKMHAVQLKYSM